MLKSFSLHPLLMMLVLSACTPSQTPTVDRPASDILKKAKTLMGQGSYEKASDEFDEAERQYPYAENLPQIQLQSAWCAYKAKSYERAISALDTFISLNPVSPHAAYAYYLRALCYADQIEILERDQENTQLAHDAFESLIKLFPQTPYARAARLKLQRIKDQLAAKDFIIAKFYMNNQDLLAAASYFCNFINTHLTSPLWPEAVYRMLELQRDLGLSYGIPTIQARLARAHPQSSWTQKAISLLRSLKGRS